MLPIAFPFTSMPSWGPTAWAPALDMYTRGSKELEVTVPLPPALREQPIPIEADTRA